jgi:hypothetical protein
MSLKGSLRGDDVIDMAPDLRFDTDDPEFQRGFEIGVLWERLVTDGACNMAVSASNAEMVIRVAQAFGCQFSGREIEDDQISVELYQMHGQ